MNKTEHTTDRRQTMESHQELGNRLELFFIDSSSPGSIFWKP